MASATTSDWLYEQQMKYFFQQAPQASIWTASANLFVGLFTTAPNQAGTTGVEVEVADPSYSRQSTYRDVGVNGWSYDAGLLQFSIIAEISWNPPGASWGTVVAAGLFFTNDTTPPPFANDNHLLFVANLSTNKTVNVGDGGPKILAGQLRVSRASC